MAVWSSGVGTPAFQLETLFRRYNVAIFSSNYALYGSMSQKVFNCLYSLVEDVEVYSIDEAFLGLSGYDYLEPDLVDFARRIRARVAQWTGIPVSIGISPTKTLAKMANKRAKKDAWRQGVYQLTDYGDIVETLRHFPVGDLWGVGSQYGEKFIRHGMTTALHVAEAPDYWLKKAKAGWVSARHNRPKRPTTG